MERQVKSRERASTAAGQRHASVTHLSVPDRPTHRLQRAIGNRAVTGMLQLQRRLDPLKNQTRWRVDPGDDRLEQEADRVTDRVVHTAPPEPRFGYDFRGVRLYTGSPAAALAQLVQAHAFTLGPDVVIGNGNLSLESSLGRHLLAHELTHVVQQGAAKSLPGMRHHALDLAVVGGPMLMRQKVEEETAARPNIVSPKGKRSTAAQQSPRAIQAQLGPGRALDSAVKTAMEPAFGTDFSHVRVHVDAGAARLARSLQARAFTVGEHIAFDPAEYRPGTPIGDALIAHELAHVVQQSSATWPNRAAEHEADEGGGSTYNDLEGAASLSAARVVLSLWIRAQGTATSLTRTTLPQLRSGLRLQRCSTSKEAEPGGKPKTAAITKGGYVTFPVPTPGDQRFIVQFYRPPGTREGATLRFKSDQDPRPPAETPIPAGGNFAPILLHQSNDEIRFSLTGGKDTDLTVRLAAGQRTEKHYAINPRRPYGPLLIDAQFQRRYVEAIIEHPGGTERYSWRESLPDEAIAGPTWVPHQIPGRHAIGDMFRAVRGKYARQVVHINYGEAATLRGLEDAMVVTAKLMAELALYSIPYVGPVLIIGQALVGKTIWGERISAEGRVLLGLLALVPIASRLNRAAAAAEAEAVAASELAAANGISQSNALALIRGARTFTAEERSFVEAAGRRIQAGDALTAQEASRLAALLNKIGAQNQLIFSAVREVEAIWTARRYWGMTEGSVYGAKMPVTTWQERLKAGLTGMRREGTVVFQGDAAKLFHAHEIEGPYSAMKRLLGQQKAGFGDIIIESAVKEGNMIIVTQARLAAGQHAGQTTAWATARLWGRRLALEPLAAAGVGSGGVLVYLGYDWLSEDSGESTAF
jgi:hypothetical protein